MNEWRRAIRTPLSYSVPGSGSSLIRKQTNFVTFVIIMGAFALLVLYAIVPQSNSSIRMLDDEHGHNHERANNCNCVVNQNIVFYNRTYPITPIEPLNDGRLKYKIAAVADLDTKSRQPNQSSWASYLLSGAFIIDPHTSTVEITWEKNEEQLVSEFSSGGRGMELSDLVVFNGKLYSCDDRTGIVYEIQDSQVIPWVILSNGNGFNKKGFKCEWMLVKDDHLYVGGLGKEWTSSTGDVVLNHDPQWVKRISISGEVEHLDWRLRYIELRKAAGIEAPGYLIHEAAVWSEKNSRWYFLPRRASKLAYDELLDEQRGTNILLTADSSFTSVNYSGNVGPLVKSHGFSSVKLLPLPTEITLQPKGAEIAVAIKSEEDNNIISTYVTVFRLPDGHVLLPETRFSTGHKYEGIEFV